MQYQLAAIFVGQKKNKINRVTLISQYSNEVFENEKQLVNIDFKHMFGFSRYKISLGLNLITRSQ